MSAEVMSAGALLEQYRAGGATPWALLMLELGDDRITGMTSYLDVETLFPRFGLPMRLVA